MRLNLMRVSSLIPPLMLGASLLGGCGIETGDETERIAALGQALEPVAPGTRRDIHDLNAEHQQALAGAILEFITQPILDEHAAAHDWHHPTVGELFFVRHHEYLNKLEDYLTSNGYGEFVPLPEWDPGTPIPEAFLVADELVTQAPLNANPNRPMPAELEDLCSFSSLSSLAQAVESWHDGVHGTVGGAMGTIPSAPGAPIFWLWHGLLDDIHHNYEWECEGKQALPRVGWISAVL